MIKQLQRHLTFLFTMATGVILTLVLIVVFIYQTRLNSSQDNTFFQSQLFDLTHQLESASGFSDDWLAKSEAEQKLIIHIEDNGVPLFFQGAWNPPTSRESLIAAAQKKALEEGIDINSRPYSASLLKSTVFTLKGEHRDTYQGSVLVLATAAGFRSLVLLADTSDARREFFLQIIFYFFLETLGILALTLASRHVVSKAVLPIKEYHQRQNEFISAASHELRSPLAVIQLSASAILSMPEHASAMAKSIRQECIRSGKLIKNLLLLSSEDNLSEKLCAIEIDTLLLQLFETYEPLCNSKGIRLYLKLPDEFLPKVMAHYQWVYQILSIFIDNAIAYGCTKEKPVLQLSAEIQAKELYISVIDHGTGIPDDQKERIFDRFYRADASRSDKEHSGLGLSIAKTLAAHMPLTIDVTDTPGGGSTFQVHFFHTI